MENQETIDDLASDGHPATEQTAGNNTRGAFFAAKIGVSLIAIYFATLVTYFPKPDYNKGFGPSVAEAAEISLFESQDTPAQCTIFKDNEDGTITAIGRDGKKLMWTADAHFFYKAYNWNDAKKKVEELVYPEEEKSPKYSDWRLPTVEEWKQMIDSEKQCPALASNYFSDTVNKVPYWTADEFFYLNGTAKNGAVTSAKSPHEKDLEQITNILKKNIERGRADPEIEKQYDSLKTLLDKEREKRERGYREKESTKKEPKKQDDKKYNHARIVWLRNGLINHQKKSDMGIAWPVRTVKEAYKKTPQKTIKNLLDENYK